MYLYLQNEIDVGIGVRNAIANGFVTREEVYITSKISPYEQGACKARKACEEILNRLDLGYVDLLLIHWPGVAKQKQDSPENSVKRRETWEVMEEFVAKGHVRALGVSNFEIHHLQDLLSYATIRPIVNQVELHPLYPQEELRIFCKEHDIKVVGYSCFGSGALFDPGEYKEPSIVAKNTGKTLSQVLLCWGLQQECCVLAKSEQQERIQQFSPLNPGMRPDEDGRYLSIENESLLCSMGASLDARKKFCWDPSHIA